MIYRNFEHWWSEGKHGYSSASKEDAEAIWEDLAPTLIASLDDRKRAYLVLAQEQAEKRSELVTAMLDYIEAHQKRGQPTFWSWWMDQKIERKKSEPYKPIKRSKE